jgi:hypothetical protein
MILVTLFAALFIMLLVTSFMAATRFYFKDDNLNDIVIAAVFFISFILVNEQLKHFEFCESAVMKVCPADQTEYRR